MVEKYVILSDSDNIEPFKIPRQLTKINGETLIGRTVRLLKENGVKDILITSHDKRFDNLGATRYEPLYNDYKPKLNEGYWVSAYPIELLNQPICFLLGDVYYSENAIKTIVEEQTDSILFFCSYKNKDKRYIKHHDEPFAFKVVDYVVFKEHIERMKDFKDSGKAPREPIAWELYRSINNQPLTIHKMTDNYIAINDESCDVDRLDDIIKLELVLGGDNMIKCEVIKEFTLERFDELKNIQRKAIETKGKLYVGDVFECNKELADYLMGNNLKGETVVKVVEVVPEKEATKININVTTELDGKKIAEKVIEYEEKPKKRKTTRKRKTNEE